MIDNIKHIYPPNLEKEIIKNKFIPRKIRENEHLKLFHKYWINEYKGVIKVNDIFLAGNVEYYSIKFDNRMSACISHPIATSCCYELLHNKEGIETKNIINDGNSYSGAEIKYWFVLNKIDFDNKEFSGFWSFVSPDSSNVLIDNKYYKIVYDKNRKQKHQIILDKSKL